VSVAGRKSFFFMVKEASLIPGERRTTVCFRRESAPVTVASERIAAAFYFSIEEKKGVK